MPGPVAPSNAHTRTFPCRELPPKAPLVHIPTTCNLGGLNSTHLADPSSRGLDLAYGTDFIAGVAGNADIIATLKGELDIANL
jgi:hypothetical protein